MKNIRNIKFVWFITLISILFSFQGCAKEVKMPNQEELVNMPSENIVLGMGCFWGAEKRLSAINGVIDVESGYAGGDNKNAGYENVLEVERQIKQGNSNIKNHAEVIKVTFNPDIVSLEEVLIAFWENHNPTQGNRQGNDVGTNYRSAIFISSEAQKIMAHKTAKIYQSALDKAKKGKITTEIAPLINYITAEEYHQDYLKKNVNGYCGLGGIGIAYPGSVSKQYQILDAKKLNFKRQLIVFEAEECPYCKKFKQDVLNTWSTDVDIISTLRAEPPKGWILEKALFATPTIVLFEEGKEVSRYTGYNGDKSRFWKWIGFRILTPEQRRVAFEQGTEIPFTGSHLDEKRPGYFVDPITGDKLFRSDTKFDSGTGWPSFFNPVENAIVEKIDTSKGMRRVEVVSASSGIHLGHVFDDGPAPTYKRYCINGNVLKFIPD